MAMVKHAIDSNFLLTHFQYSIILLVYRRWYGQWFFFSFAGTATGCAVDVNDLKSIHNKCSVPIVMGSGVNLANVRDYFYKAHAAIIGSYFKRDGHWSRELDEHRISQFMEKIRCLREIE